MLERILRSTGVLLACALGPAEPVPASGEFLEETRKLTPLRVRDMGFPGVMLLGFAPAPARTLREGMWRVETHYEHSSIFTMSDNMMGYLEERPGPLDEVDIAALEALDEEIYFFDGEIGRLDLGVHYGVTNHVEIVATVGYLTYTGGSLDGMIDNFHENFGIDDNGRDLVPEGQLQAAFIGIFGETRTIRDSPGGGLTDPTLRLRWGGPDFGRGWQIGLEAAVKFPIGDDECYHTSGNTDVGFRLALEKAWKKTGMILNGYYIAAGNFDRLRGFDQSDPIGFSASYVRTVGRRFSLNLQVLTQRNLFDDATFSSLAEPEFQLSAGFTARVSRRNLVQFSYTNNYLNYDNTPDLVFQVGFTSFVD